MNFNSSQGLMRSGTRNMTMGFGLKVLEGGSISSAQRDGSPNGKRETLDSGSKQERELMLTHRNYTDKEGEEM